MNKTFIIAEAGANHDGDYTQALKLVDIAVEAGCDAVKFQTYSADTLYSKKTPNFAGYKDVHKLIQSLELPREWQKSLKDYCNEKGIEFMSTPFDRDAVNELCALKAKRFKIAGFEATDARFVKMVASTRIPLIITVGIGCDLEMMEKIYSWVCEVYPEPDLTFLHGNHAYPTPIKEINLGHIKNMQQRFAYHENIKFGLSDHTESIYVPSLAVAMGATVIEKHFTLDRTLLGPDHSFALEPDELKEMVRLIRIAEITSLIKFGKITESEKEYKMAMRSVVASRNVEKEEILNQFNITTKRPFVENAIPAEDFFECVGKKAICDLKEDDILTYDKIQ